MVFWVSIFFFFFQCPRASAEGQCPRSSFVTSILIIVVVVVVVIYFVFGTDGITDTSWLIRVALAFVEYC